GLDALVVVGYGNRLVYLDAAALDTADTDTANVLVVVDGRYQHLHRAFGVYFGCRDMLENLVKQRNQIGARYGRGHGSRAVTTRAVNDRAVQLLVVCVQI